jgi:hypothetical protein
LALVLFKCLRMDCCVRFARNSWISFRAPRTQHSCACLNPTLSLLSASSCMCSCKFVALYVLLSCNISCWLPTHTESIISASPRAGLRRCCLALHLDLIGLRLHSFLSLSAASAQLFLFYYLSLGLLARPAKATAMKKFFNRTGGDKPKLTKPPPNAREPDVSGRSVRGLPRLPSYGLPSQLSV